MTHKEQLKKQQEIMNSIQKMLPHKFGVTMLMFPFNRNGHFTYINNAPRKDMKRSLKTLLNKWEKEDEL